MALRTDEMMKASVHMTEAYTDPTLHKAYLPTETAFSIALKTKLPYWEWLESRTNECSPLRLKRTAAAMNATRSWEDEDGIISGKSTHCLITCLSYRGIGSFGL